jgi:hypothetical protein
MSRLGLDGLEEFITGGCRGGRGRSGSEVVQ